MKKQETTHKQPKASKAQKMPKRPSLFKKPIPQKKFEKKYLKLLAQKADIAMMRASFSLHEGTYILNEGLDAPTLKRLGVLAKAIRANTGWIKTGPLVATGLLAGAAAVFLLFFANPLLQKAAELGLQKVFQARVEVSGFRFSLLGPSLSFASMQAADRDEPMRNLIELGKTEFTLDWAHLLRGAFYLKTGRIENLAFGTERSESGALPEYPAVPQEEKAGRASTSGGGTINLANFDAQALLEQQKDNLKTTAAVEAAKAAWDTAATEWPARVESSSAAVQDFQGTVTRLGALDVQNIKSVGEVTSALNDVNAAINSGKTIVGEARGISDGISRDINAATRLEREARASIKTDMAYLKSFMDPESGAAFNALEPLMEQILSDKAQQAVRYGLKALELLKRVRGDDTDAADTGKNAAVAAEVTAAAEGTAAGAETIAAAYPEGRTVTFASRGYARFRLGECVSSFNDGERDWYIRIADIASEPEVLSAPSVLVLKVDTASWNIAVETSADTRSAEALPWSLSASGAGLPVALGEELAALNVSAFTGSAAGSVQGEGSGETLLLSADISVREPKVSGASDSVGSAVQRAVNSVDAVELAITHQDSAEAEPRFSLSSNLDAIIGDILAELAAEAIETASAELEDELSAMLERELGTSSGSKNSVLSLGQDASGNVSSVNKGQTVVNTKKQELEKQAASFTGNALRGLRIPGL